MADEKKSKFGVITAALIIAAGSVCACLLIKPAARTISAVGICRAKIERDKLTLALQITALNKNAADSLKIARSGADEVARRIKTIEDKSLEIQTKDVSSYDKTQWKDNNSVKLGTETAITLEITTSNRDSADAILNSLPKIAGAEVLTQSLRNFSSAAVIGEASAKCLESAIGDARAKAAALAAGDGEKLGRMISARFFDADNGDPSPVRFRAKGIAAAITEFADLQSANGDLSVSVEATFGIR
ncbi:MAG: SIMPL domain-containing protein [Rickettsiales bacterium]|jgi:uncharacterized protein YggE|nr:SIMPL domain-containing protein [Rickettsiales bacterium]